MERLPTPVFWPGEFHGLYSPWGHKESDTTEQLSLSGLDREEGVQTLDSMLGSGQNDLGLLWSELPPRPCFFRVRALS